MKAPRVVSLLPSATEILCALGQQELLVGRSHECDFPPGVEHLPVCTAPVIDPAASSAAIDRAVKERLQQALSLYQVDQKLLADLRPDLILTQAQCEVCAVSLSDVESALGEWTGQRPKVLSLSPKHFTDLWSDMRTVAAAVGLADEGRAVMKPLKFRCVDVIERVCSLGRRPTVACVEWLSPLMAAGNWVPDMVELAGGTNVFGQAGEHSPWLAWEELRQRNPEIVLVLPCGFSLERVRQEMGLLTTLPGWSELRAVKGGRVYLIDGNQYFNRPGPRLVDSLEILAEMIHPGVFPAKYEGQAWLRLGSEAITD